MVMKYLNKGTSRGPGEKARFMLNDIRFHGDPRALFSERTGWEPLQEIGRGLPQG